MYPNRFVQRISSFFFSIREDTLFQKINLNIKNPCLSMINYTLLFLVQHLNKYLICIFPFMLQVSLTERIALPSTFEVASELIYVDLCCHTGKIIRAPRQRCARSLSVGILMHLIYTDRPLAKTNYTYCYKALEIPQHTSLYTTYEKKNSVTNYTQHRTHARLIRRNDSLYPPYQAPRITNELTKSSASARAKRRNPHI